MMGFYSVRKRKGANMGCSVMSPQCAMSVTEAGHSGALGLQFLLHEMSRTGPPGLGRLGMTGSGYGASFWAVKVLWN